MPSCASCGGDNPAAALNCQYCDQPLVGEKHLEVTWTASTQGTTGEGRASLLAPSGADVQRVRALCEAAFTKSVEALGSQATVDQLQADMRERLIALLPHDHPLESLEVTRFEAFVLVAGKVEEPAAAPAPAPASPAPARSGSGLSFGRSSGGSSWGGSSEDSTTLADLVIEPVLWVLGLLWKIVWWTLTLPFKISFGSDDGDDDGCCGCVVLLVALPLGGGALLRLLA